MDDLGRDVFSLALFIVPGFGVYTRHVLSHVVFSYYLGGCDVVLSCSSWILGVYTPCRHGFGAHRILPLFILVNSPPPQLSLG